MTVSPRHSQIYSILNLDITLPAVAAGKCACFCSRKIDYDGVVYDDAQKRLVAKEPAHMTVEEKSKMRTVLKNFINEKIEKDPVAFAIICKFIDFDPEKSQTIKIRQIQKLKEILEMADKEKLRQSQTIDEGPKKE